MRKREARAEWLPWYRSRDYKGNLTEAQKRQLDAFRSQAKHPAARAEDLPQEVQNYINGIELALYDCRQQEAVTKALFVSFIGALLFALRYSGYLSAPAWSYAFDVLLLVVPWVFYRREWKNNAEAFLPSQKDAPNPTDEGIRKEWELNHIQAMHSRS